MEQFQLGPRMQTTLGAKTHQGMSQGNEHGH